MVVLADLIRVLPRFARSANVERDSGQAGPLEGYVVTARALDVVEQIAAIAATKLSGGAWSLTGPYGSGKSSLALLLDAALGPAGTTQDVARRLIAEASPTVGELVRRAHDKHQTGDVGFYRGLVTAAREPLSHTILRALLRAVEGVFGEIPPASEFTAANTLKSALDDMRTDDPRRIGPSPAALVDIAKCLAEDAPLLLIIDEFGKSLEAIRDSAAADPYLLQQLAEAGQGAGLPIFILTLQHLSFEDYLVHTDDTKRREWAKVQGRFEHVSYVESASQYRAFIGKALEVEDDVMRGRIGRWARSEARTMGSLGIKELSDPEVLAACYPLHPLVATVLPELCNRYGQHERTLFSFLTSADPASAASFLQETRLADVGTLPTLGLDAVYDYFVANSTLGTLSAGQSTRWGEIATLLRDAHRLSDRQRSLAKTIAILNLVSTTGVVRASRRLLAQTGLGVAGTLAELEAAGIVTYRGFADEYRIWRGTDIDIRSLLDAARQQTHGMSLVEILSAVDQPGPVVAARHSAKNDVLRVFARRYVDGHEVVPPLDTFSSFDGEVVLVVGSIGTVPVLAKPSVAAKPIVAAIPSDVTDLENAAREIAAITAVLEDPVVERDWVARRELGERLAQARVVLEHAINTAFRAEACRWKLLDASGGRDLSGGRGTAALSEAADLVYPSTPRIGNEMLNRTAVTSQGAKARRLLLEAMIERGSQPGLGLLGYGPEVAMYRAFLDRTELHSADGHAGTLAFGKPREPTLQPAWEVVEGEFRRAKTRRISLSDIYAALIAPPVGMKRGVIPVFVTVALLAFSEEIAIYEHGTFKPLLTPELSERMVRNPSHFEVKHFAHTSGARREVVDLLAKHLGVRPGFGGHRVRNVLTVVGHLISRVRYLENYTLRTRNLSPTTMELRNALIAAVEPDDLLFGGLPVALGLPPVPANSGTYPNARQFAERLRSALDELTGCYEELLSHLFAFLLEISGETSRLAVTGQAAALENEVLNPEVRAFVLTLANDSVDTSVDWITAVATVVSKKAPAEWTDEDRSRFRRELPQQIAAFQRLVALHAERRADGGGPFNSLRVTVTKPDGSEHVQLVSVDQSERDQVTMALDRAAEELVSTMGSGQRVYRAILAVLGERLLPEQMDGDEEVRETSTDNHAQHA